MSLRPMFPVRVGSRRRTSSGSTSRKLQLEQLEPRYVFAGQVLLDPGAAVGTISNDLIGTNVLYAYENDAAWSDGRVAASLKNIGTGFIRYPGGEVTSSYHWNAPHGAPWHDTWDPRLPPKPPIPGEQWMNFDEYMRQVRLAGAKPLVGVNLQSGHNFNRVDDGVKEAVALVRYAKSRDYGVQHYFLDNEPYTSQNGISPDKYAEYINRYANAMREVDPGIKIVVNWQNFFDDGWKTILDRAGRNIDYIDLHCYWNRDDASFENWRGDRLMTQRGETYGEKILDFRREIQARGLDTKIAVFEWNLGPTKASERPSAFQAALMNSEIFMQFTWGKLDAAAFWPLHWKSNSPGGEAARSLLTSNELRESPVYQMLSLYKDLLGTKLLASKAGSVGVPVTAGYDPATDTTTVMLLEKAGRTNELSVALGPFLKQSGDFTIRAQAFRAANGDHNSDRAEIIDIPYTLNRTTGEIKLTLSGYTLTKLTVQHHAAIPTTTPTSAPIQSSPVITKTDPPIVRTSPPSPVFTYLPIVAVIREQPLAEVVEKEAAPEVQVNRKARLIDEYFIALDDVPWDSELFAAVLDDQKSC